jgi:putative effector of murein hydrolase
VTPDLGHLFGTVTVTGSAVGALHAGAYTFTPGGLYSDQLGYMISYSAGSLTIVPARLTVAGSTASKVYDGTTAVVLTGGSLVGVIGGDTITLTQAGSFASKNAGTGIAVSVSDSIGGASAGDYTLVEPTGVTGTITPAALTVSGTTVGSKTYNGTTAADLAGGSLVGVIGGDTVTLTQAGSFASKNVGTGIAVTANDSLGGTDASNYTIVEPTGLTGSVTPATLTVSGTAVGNKTYNGSNVAPLTGGTLVGVVSGDSVTLNQSGTFASIGVGSGIAVTATDALSGADAGDYRLTEPTGLTGSILPAPSAGRANGPNVSVLAAQNAETQIVENLLYPQLGARPQVIDALPTIQAMAGSAADVNASASAETATQQAIAVNVSMKIGATGTLKIENGGLRLPGNLVIGNE